MLNRYIESPVLMSFDSSPRPISEIPFPAITICNMNKVGFPYLFFYNCTVKKAIQIGKMMVNKSTLFELCRTGRCKHPESSTLTMR